MLASDVRSSSVNCCASGTVRSSNSAPCCHCPWPARTSEFSTSLRVTPGLSAAASVASIVSDSLSSSPASANLPRWRLMRARSQPRPARSGLHASYSPRTFAYSHHGPTVISALACPRQAPKLQPRLVASTGQGWCCDGGSSEAIGASNGHRAAKEPGTARQKISRCRKIAARAPKETRNLFYRSPAGTRACCSASNFVNIVLTLM